MVCCNVLKYQICYDHQRVVNRLNLQFLEIDALRFKVTFVPKQDGRLESEPAQHAIEAEPTRV